MIAEPAKRPIMKSEKVPLEIVSRGFFRCAGNRVLREANHETRDAHLRAYVEEFGDDAANQMLVMPDILVSFGRSFRFRQRFAARLRALPADAREIDQSRDEQEIFPRSQDTFPLHDSLPTPNTSAIARESSRLAWRRSIRFRKE